MSETRRARDRFGLGARPDDPRRLDDPRGWLREQLGAPAAFAAADLPAEQEIHSALGAVTGAQRARDPEAAQAAARELGALLERERRAVLEQRLRSRTPLVERLVAFWSNLLCVSVPGKLPLAALAGPYERQAIRPHVLGSYADMVRASARHPAMLVYLDNAQSIGPDSRGARFLARARGRERGLNENYARELLELHTLGVDGGYVQADVEALARILTGWSIAGLGPLARAGERIDFVFRAQLHEPGDKTLLGRRYEVAGVEEGERAIADLCAHPATARFLATKLVRHFVADDPPADAVDTVAAAFRDSAGDLRVTTAALIDLPAAWDPSQLKFRSPQDWLVAVGRAAGLDRVPARLSRVLQSLRQPLWAPPSPQGYDDTLAAWADPDSLMNRAELARSVADALPQSDVAAALDALSDDGTAPGALAGERSIAPRERLALAFGGPDFQWR